LHIFSPELLNEVKFGFNRGTVLTTNLGPNRTAFFSRSPRFHDAEQQPGEDRRGQFVLLDRQPYLGQNKHVIKSGVEVRRIQLNQGNSASGSISFVSPTAFAANQVNSASFAAALPVNGLRKTQFYAFLQDEYKWKPNLTLNLGLRYQFFNRFHEVLGRAVPF